MRNFLFVTSMLFVAYSSLAEVSTNPQASHLDTKYFEIASIEVREVLDVAAPVFNPSVEENISTFFSPLESPLAFGEGVMLLNQIINIGSKLWKIVESGRPVVNAALKSANALPQGALHWDQMQGWQNPISKIYNISAKNLYGVKVVDFSYRLSYISGGSFKGQGRYLNSVRAQTEKLTVLWGYTFESNVEVLSTSNVGTLENPIGAIELMLKWKISSVVKYHEASSVYHIRGDGLFREL